MPDLNSETIQALIPLFATWGPWFAFGLIFIFFGLQHIAPIITAIGTVFNERHKANLSHKRAMTKIENQTAKPAIGKKPQS